MSLLMARAATPLYDTTPVSVETIPEVFSGLQRVRPFYFEDSQVVLQASHSIIMLPSAL